MRKQRFEKGDPGYWSWAHTVALMCGLFVVGVWIWYFVVNW